MTHPGIADIAVVGRHDEVAGDLPTAFVVPKRDNVSDRSLVSEKDILDFMAGKNLSRSQ